MIHEKDKHIHKALDSDRAGKRKELLGKYSSFINIKHIYSKTQEPLIISKHTIHIQNSIPIIINDSDLLILAQVNDEKYECTDYVIEHKHGVRSSTCNLYCVFHQHPKKDGLSLNRQVYVESGDCLIVDNEYGRIRCCYDNKHMTSFNSNDFEV